METNQDKLWKSFCKRYDAGEKFTKEELATIAHSCKPEDYDCGVYDYTDIGDLCLSWHMVVFKCGKRYFQIEYEDQDEGPEWFNNQPIEVKPHIVKKIEWISVDAIKDCAFTKGS